MKSKGIIGCCLFYYLIISCKSVESSKPSYEKNISGIIQKHCVICHQNNGIAPFPLVNYEQVKKRAKSIAFVTSHQLMPPWPADTSYTHFSGEKVLTEQEIITIQDWVKNGCLAGNLTNILPTKEYSYRSFIGKPDLTLTFKEDIKIHGSNQDRFYLMKFPFELSKDTIVSAIEFIPGNRKAVHHVNGHLIQYEDENRKDVFTGPWCIDAEENTANKAYEILNVANDDGSFPMLTQSAVNYLPGAIATHYPEGISGYRIKRKGAILLRDIHYGPSKIDTIDNSIINIFFAKKTTNRVTRELQMGTLGITDIEPPLVIAPDSIQKFTTRAKINKDVSILTVNPHMHRLGKSFIAYAVKATGDTIPLIRINDWNFNWQYFYTYKHPLHIPAGSVIVAEGVYDNTVHNPMNPFHPPKLVSEQAGSMKSSDEMFQFIITLIDYRQGDEFISLD